MRVLDCLDFPVHRHHARARARAHMHMCNMSTSEQRIVGTTRLLFASRPPHYYFPGAENRGGTPPGPVSIINGVGREGWDNLFID